MTATQLWQSWRLGLKTLQVLRPVTADLTDLTTLIDSLSEPDRLEEGAAAAARLTARLWEERRSWPEVLAERIVWQEHPLALWAEEVGPRAQLPAAMLQAAERDLAFLQELALQLPEAVAETLRSVWTGSDLAWPPFEPPLDIETSATEVRLAASNDWTGHLPEMVELWSTFGAGVLGRYDAFRWSGATRSMEPIVRPDPISLADLQGYRRQREAVLANTEQFVQGHLANNLLLYGDRGTGKSSLVKALRREYAPQGLRLVEVAKEDLNDLPLLLEQITGRRGRFLVFIDDLSFGEGEDYRGLKAILEGSLVARPDHVIIYATTNRRHLVHETIAERLAVNKDGETSFVARRQDGGAEALNPRDLLQEKLSLADRFGKTINFPAPDQDEYLAIVHHLVQQAGLVMDEDEVERQALLWAQRHNARSGRTARQFVNDLKGKSDLAAISSTNKG